MRQLAVTSNLVSNAEGGFTITDGQRGEKSCWLLRRDNGFSCPPSSSQITQRQHQQGILFTSPIADHGGGGEEEPALVGG
jgi:hypothetical protein